MQDQTQPQPNQQPVQPTSPEVDSAIEPQEQASPVSGEIIKPVESKPEQIMPQEPSEEISQDGGPVQPQQPPAINLAQPQVSDNQIISDASDEDKEKDMEKLDKKWVKAVDDVIDKFEDKPFEEEETAEDLQIDYLDKRFGKKLGKSKD